MITKKSKRSQGHVEIILSFTIFIGFLMAIFYFLSPISNGRTSYSALNAVEERLLENSSITYKQVSLIIKNNATNGTACFSADNSVDFSGSVIIRDKKADIAESNVNSSQISIKNKNSDIYTIYSSGTPDGFNNYSLSESGCTSIEESNYSFGAPSINKIVLFENLQELNQNYLADYESLKSALGLENDFEFAVYSLNREVLMNETLSAHKIKLSSVLSRDILIKSMNKNASYVDIILNLRVW